MDFNLCKLQTTLKGLRERAVRESAPVTQRFRAQDPCKRHEPAGFPAACEKLAFAPFGPRERWGEPFESCVFRMAARIPGAMDGLRVCLRVRTGREGGYTAFNPQFLAYVDGKLVQGMDINHTELLLRERARAGETVQVLLHAFAGTERGTGLMELETSLVCEYECVRRLADRFETALLCLMALNRQAGEYCALEGTLLQAADEVLFHLEGEEFLQSARAALEVLDRRVYSGRWSESPVTVHCIGHTHIDVAWRWTVEQSRQKALRSFSTVVSLMETYPQYRFFSSQPVLYDFVKKDDPALFERIRALVKAGRWEAEGGMWLEPDCNLPSGESLVRQIYYGKKFLREEFGVDSHILWLPDSFGYCAVLPQLMRGAGLDSFLTSKLSWNEFNSVPHDVFLWEGPDGSRVTASMVTSPDDEGLPNSPDFTTYNATLQPKNVLGAWNRMRDKAVTNEVAFAYGFGDGGGGPTREMLEHGINMEKGLPGLPSVRFSTAENYFSGIARDLGAAKRAPVFRGELYLEFHRGTYTTAALAKQNNRRAERAMRALEYVQSAAGKDDPEGREQLWKLIMLSQFHDVLPGSAIEAVYRDCEADYARVFDRSEEMLREAAGCKSGDARALFVVNALGRGGLRALYLKDDGRTVARGGKRAPSQNLGDGRRLVMAELDAWSAQTFSLTQAGQAAGGGHLRADGRTLENRFFRIRLAENGAISSLVDKRANRELLRPGRLGNLFALYEDRPATCEAWNIDVTYTEKKRELPPAHAVNACEQGPLSAAICLEWRFGRSAIRQKIRLYEQIARIDFETEVDWHECQTLLKVEFPLDVRAEYAQCGSPFGYVTRPTHQNTSWEEARFEFCAHRYVDLSEADYGVALFTGDKYGADLLDAKIGLSLLKAPLEPWKGVDEGTHRFTYALYPHAGDAAAADVYGQSMLLEQPVMLETVSAGAPALPAVVRCEQENVMIEAVKPAEDGDGVIVRLVEYKNARCEAKLISPAFALRSAALCDLNEEHPQSLPLAGNCVTVALRPREIKTVRLSFSGADR